MTRRVSEIKAEIATAFMNNEWAAGRYGFEPGSNFGDYFGAASVENIIFYVWAVCAWTLEQLVERLRGEVEQALEEQVAHRPKWYREKVLAFMADKELIEDTDRYDMAGMTESEIEAARVVKHAVAIENSDSGVLTIKVAGERDGERGPLKEEEEAQLRVYIGEIKDAGVRVALVNREGDEFGCEVDIYYNALLGKGTVEAGVKRAIRDYIENLPFNGEYTNMGLVDRLQGVEGVRIVELRNSQCRTAGESVWTAIRARVRASAGYFKFADKDVKVNMKAYDGED